MITQKSMSALGAKAGLRTHASLNSEVLRMFIATNHGKSVELYIDGEYYLDLSSGSIKLVFGKDGFINLKVHGPGSLIGVSPASHVTPVLEIIRAPGTIQFATIQDLTISSAGSGIKVVRGGTHCVLRDVIIRDCHGHSPIPIKHTGWDDFDTCTYGLKIENSDGFFADGVTIIGVSGHGVICDRWHAGGWKGYVRQCRGVGMKLQRVNGTEMHARAESNEGYGFMMRDSGIGKRVGRTNVVDEGTGDYWRVWQENNGSRDPQGIRVSKGHKYPGIRLENCAGKVITGHLGSKCNQIILDQSAKYLCSLEEKVPIPTCSPDRTMEDLVLPTHQRWRSNWWHVWDDERYRPIFLPETNQVVCPPMSLDRVSVPASAYWRMFLPLESPGLFCFQVTVRDVTGAIAKFCQEREAVEGKSRQTARRFCVSIAPVSGCITAFPIWDTDKLTLTGAFRVESTRKDITLSFQTFMKGIETLPDGVMQTEEHRVEILTANMWKLPLGV